MRIAARFFIFALIAGVCQIASYAAETVDRPDRDALGRSVKLRILVDKVLQKHKDWVTEEWMIRESADAGFNVYSPRKGNDDMDAVRRVNQWCCRYGIYHIPWMRGTLSAPPGAPEDDRMVWADGTVSKLYSPNSDAFWNWTSERIVKYAKIAADDPTLIGVFLDYENYEPTRKPNCYDLSYDLSILRRFAAEEKIDLPPLAPAERKPWLERQGLHDRFEAYQISHWRLRCRTLRTAVDAHDRSFGVCL